MERAGADSLTAEQSKNRGQLAIAVEDINKADELLAQNSNDLASHRATALALTALARILVLETGDKWGMLNRLPPFKRAPK